MIYEHIEGVEVTAQFTWENNLPYRYRLEIVLKDAAPSGKTVCVVMQNPGYQGRRIKGLGSNISQKNHDESPAHDVGQGEFGL